MPRPEEVDVVAAMKAAKTGEEILASWALQRPGYKAGGGGDPSLGFWVDNKVEMLHTFAQNQLTQLLDRGILDPKTRYLLLVGLYMMNNHWDGVLPQACNAKAAGATDEEIMEVAFIANYGASKTWLVEICQALGKAFESDNYKNTKIAE